MDDVFSMAEAVADKLKNSESYTEYLSVKQKINNDPELKYQISAFRKANFDYQYRFLNNESPSFEEEKAVSSIYWKLMSNADAKKYLECEKSIVERLERIYNIIGSACELDLYMPDEQ
jgi:cell fate (sporulation/competence/biofilm development) regulator YlbF (YheA/YmcA/DUF963 family)